MTVLPLVREALLDALALVLPTECAVCGAPDRAVCAACALELTPAVTRLAVRQQGRAPLLVWAGSPYCESVARALSLLKEHGRTDVAPALSRLLAASVTDARLASHERLPAGAELTVVAAPSSRAAFRARGYNPVDVLLRCAKTQLACIRALRVARTVADQAGLGVSARQTNLEGSLALRARFPEGSLKGRFVLIVDDVVTTGATLLECRGALERGGAQVFGAATLAYAERHSGRSAVERVGVSATERAAAVRYP